MLSRAGTRGEVDQKGGGGSNGHFRQGPAVAPLPHIDQTTRHLTRLASCPRQGLNFSVIITEGRPDATGLKMVRALDDMNVPSTLVLDSGVAYVMER